MPLNIGAKLLRLIPLQRPVDACPHLQVSAPPFLTFFEEHSWACGDKEVFLELWKGHLISLLFNSFYFFNYENITHLQETWKIQNKVTYSGIIYYNFLIDT